MTADEIGRMALAAYAGAIAALVLIQLILRALRRVVASASVGDPFIEANAADLVRVAWLLLGVDVVDTLIKPMVYLLAPEAVRMKMHDTVPYPDDRAVCRAADLRAGADLQAWQRDARRTRRDDLAWRSSSTSMSCFTHAA